MSRVGQNHTYTVYIRFFWQGNHQIYGHIRCICTVLANPIHALLRCKDTHHAYRVIQPCKPFLLPQISLSRWWQQPMIAPKTTAKNRQREKKTNSRWGWPSHLLCKTSTFLILLTHTHTHTHTHSHTHTHQLLYRLCMQHLHTFLPLQQPAHPSPTSTAFTCSFHHNNN